MPLFFVNGVSQHDIAQQIGFLPAFIGYAILVTAGAVQSTWIFNIMQRKRAKDALFRTRAPSRESTES
jgi:hypothetical protein